MYYFTAYSSPSSLHTDHYNNASQAIGSFQTDPTATVATNEPFPIANPLYNTYNNIQPSLSNGPLGSDQIEVGASKSKTLSRSSTPETWVNPSRKANRPGVAINHFVDGSSTETWAYHVPTECPNYPHGCQRSLLDSYNSIGHLPCLSCSFRTQPPRNLRDTYRSTDPLSPLFGPNGAQYQLTPPRCTEPQLTLPQCTKLEASASDEHSDAVQSTADGLVRPAGNRKWVPPLEPSVTVGPETPDMFRTMAMQLAKPGSFITKRGAYQNR